MTDTADTAELELEAMRRFEQANAGHQPVLFSERVARHLPSWLGSIRVRLAVLYSVILFALGALVVAGIYTAVSRKLNNTPEPQLDQEILIGPNGRPVLLNGEPLRVTDAQTLFKVIERQTNERTLDNLRRYSFYALGMLFGGSLAVGWVVAGIVLRPVGRITRVAREIEATDLSRRINLRGPNDELRQMADTFDAMLSRLDAAFESQRRLIAEASHELRNPLAVIRTNLEVVMSDPDATVDDFREAGVVVERTAQRMTTLVDDLLHYARRQEPANRAGLVDVAPIVGEIASEFRAAAERAGVRIDHVAMPALFVHGDGLQLRQALANLVANALRFAPRDTSLRVAAGADGGWVWLAVEDRGPGIAPEDQERVWLRFWRGDKRRAREEGRSGLGLTIVKQIVERHKGKVQLLSEPGKGSTFILWLPQAAWPA